MRFLKYLLILIIITLAYPRGYFVFHKQQNLPLIRRDTNKPIQGLAAYIVTLERFKARHAYVMQSIGPLGLPTYKVPDVGRDPHIMSGSELNEKVDFQAYKKDLGAYPKIGTIGVYLGHVKAWETFLESNFEFALIFEDDVSFDPVELSKAVEVLTHNTKWWDIVGLNVGHRGTPITLTRFQDIDKSLCVYLTEVTVAEAYLINRKAAERMLEKALPLKMQVDHYITRSWEFGLKFTGIEPRMVSQTFGDSTIAPTAPPSHLENAPVSFGMHLHKAMYKLQSYFMRFFYNLWVYLSA